MLKLQAITNQFERALGRLDEVLKEPVSPIIRDSAIQRFEFSLDLAWKSAKTYLEDKKGITCSSPKDCFREAYRQGLIEYDDAWIGYVDMRNETVHTYKEEIADKIFAKLPKALGDFKKLLETLGK